MKQSVHSQPAPLFAPLLAPLLARLTSSLALFGILVCIHMNFTLAHFLPSESKGVMNVMYVFFFTGTVLGAFFCPLFLPLPGGKKKPLAMGICFIAALIAVEFIFRSLGIRVWLSSAAVRNIMAIPEGIETTMCYGLFYYAWLQRPQEAGTIGQTGRTGKFCSLVLGASLLGSVLARFYSVPLLEAGIAATNPLKGAEFVFNFTKWCMVVLSASAALSIFLTRNTTAAIVQAGENLPANIPVKTNWPMILHLIGLASVFTVLNGALDMRMFPLYSDKAVYHPNYLTVAAAVLVLCFLSGRSISRFIRWFTFPAVVLFIFISCLPLFEEYQNFNIIMSTLVAIAHYTVWVVFTTAVVEYYSGGFWFYGMATVIFFSVVFAFLAPVISPFVPDSREYSVLFTVIAAVLFMLLAFRLIFPKQPQERQPLKTVKKRQEPFPATSGIEDICKERGLSQREIEVANLIIKEGLGTKTISERLCITTGTVKLHINKIYQKFSVSNQREFMALFVNRQ